jgi:hypothetical protein
MAAAALVRIGTGGAWSACGWATTRITIGGLLDGRGRFDLAGVWTACFGDRGVRGGDVIATLLVA